MGNVFRRNNEHNEQIREEPEQLIDNNNNNIDFNTLFNPHLKTIIKVKNPFYLLKETFHLEKAKKENLYFIKFKYDSLLNINCYINFNVKKNPQRNNLKQKDEYELCYIPTDKFVEKAIAINNLQKGRGQEFSNEKAILDLDYLEKNTTRRKDEYIDYEEEEEEEDDETENNNIEFVEEVNKEKRSEDDDLEKENNLEKKLENELDEYEEIFDIGIEFIPYYEKDLIEYEQNKEKNEIILISLFNIEKKENNEIEIRCVSQILKKHNFFFELKDIYDAAGNNGKCIVCYTNNRNTIFLNCRHSCCCQNCSGTLNPKVCPLCKENIIDIICLHKDIDKIEKKEKENEEEKEKVEEEEENKSNDDKGPVKSINES